MATASAAEASRAEGVSGAYTILGFRRARNLVKCSILSKYSIFRASRASNLVKYANLSKMQHF